MRSAFVCVVLCVCAFAARGALADCTCGPDYCQDDARIVGLLARKKAELSREYPARLVALLDRGPQCVARIERSPAAFGLWIVRADGAMESAAWSAENQANGMTKIRSGELKRFWIVNTKRAFSCCGEPSYDKMSDYDQEDDINTSRAIKCDKANSC